MASSGERPRETHMRMKMTRLAAVVALACAMASGAGAQVGNEIHNDIPEDFYRNKQVRLIVGHPVGNDHDVGGRLLAKYLTRHIPGRPAVIGQNMTAAASVA